MRVLWIVLFAALSMMPLGVWKVAREPNTAVEVVTAFMEAVRDGDLERAYEFVGTSVPAGRDAAFLRPEAIGEWELLAVEQPESAAGFPEAVTVTIGTEDGTARGAFTVDEYDGEFTLRDPFQTVSITASSYLSVQVNDLTVPMPLETGWDAWYNGQAQRSVTLLPGVYRFFGGEPVALLGDDEGGSDQVIGTPLPAAGEAASLQAAVNAYIDGCVEYRLTAPAGCPFATDGQVDTLDRSRVREPRDVAWTVEAYPVAAAVPGTGLYGEPVLRVEFTDPGRIVLEGEALGDGWAPFAAACRFDGRVLHVLAAPGGGVEVAPLGEAVADSCRGTE
ncbi:hypothetical protein [Glycomyces endophyticus]